LLAVGGGVAEVHQAQQVAPGRRAGQRRALGHRTGRQLRVVFVEGLDHAQAPAEAVDQVAAVDRRGVGHSSSRHQ
jgi:hypothetical protein